MKEKIYEKMKEYGWNLNYNTNKDFEEVYNTHYNFIDSCYDYLRENNDSINLNDISKASFEDMIVFMSDFLRAINDIDNTKIVGSARISLTNTHDIPLSLGYLTCGNVGQLETDIRKCNFNGYDICYLLNNSKDMIYKNWQVELNTDNIIILKGRDENDYGYLKIVSNVIQK